MYIIILSETVYNFLLILYKATYISAHNIICLKAQLTVCIHNNQKIDFLDINNNTPLQDKEFAPHEFNMPLFPPARISIAQCLSKYTYMYL